MAWNIPKIWDGGDVWILGGGPSVTKQFEIPDNIVNDVVKGIAPPSSYSPYMEFLHDKHVIGINVAYLIGNWIDIVFFGDNGFYENHLKQIITFPNLRVSCHQVVETYPKWFKYVPRANRMSYGLTNDPRYVCWNGNSGAAAINLSLHLGAKRVYLLGFDMKMSGQDQHWHDLYKRRNLPLPDPNIRRAPHEVKYMPFEKHLRCFPQIAKDAKRFGLEIINVCPDSAIQEFEKVSLKDII